MPGLDPSEDHLYGGLLHPRFVDRVAARTQRAWEQNRAFDQMPGLTYESMKGGQPGANWPGVGQSWGNQHMGGQPTVGRPSTNPRRATYSFIPISPVQYPAAIAGIASMRPPGQRPGQTHTGMSAFPQSAQVPQSTRRSQPAQNSQPMPGATRSQDPSGFDFMEWIKPYTEEFHDRTIRGIERDIEYLHRHPEKIPEVLELGAASLGGGGGRVAGRVAGAGVRGLIDLIGYIRALRRAGQAVEESESESNLSTLHQRGLKPAPKTRQVPEGMPRTWRIKPTEKKGVTMYYRPPRQQGNDVRIMQGNPDSQYLNSRNPYARWQKNGQALDAEGNIVLKDTQDAHIPIDDFVFKPEIYK